MVMSRIIIFENGGGNPGGLRTLKLQTCRAWNFLVGKWVEKNSKINWSCMDCLNGPDGQKVDMPDLSCRGGSSPKIPGGALPPHLLHHRVHFLRSPKPKKYVLYIGLHLKSIIMGASSVMG